MNGQLSMNMITTNNNDKGEDTTFFKKRDYKKLYPNLLNAVKSSDVTINRNKVMIKNLFIVSVETRPYEFTKEISFNINKKKSNLLVEFFKFTDKTHVYYEDLFKDWRLVDSMGLTFTYSKKLRHMLIHKNGDTEFSFKEERYLSPFKTIAQSAYNS